MLTRSRGLATLAFYQFNVVNDVAKQQFTVSMPHSTAYLSYEQSGQDIKFITTNVPKKFQGKGVGKLLAKNAFDYAYQHRLNVTCQCHFLAKFYNDNKKQFPGMNIAIDLAKEE